MNGSGTTNQTSRFKGGNPWGDLLPSLPEPADWTKQPRAINRVVTRHQTTQSNKFAKGVEAPSAGYDGKLLEDPESENFVPRAARVKNGGNEFKAVEGLVLVLTDHVLTAGSERHHALMGKLQERFKFGKYLRLHEEEHGTLFNGRQIKIVKPGLIHLSMKEYVDSKLSAVNVSKEVKKNPEKTLADKYVELLRTLVMKIMWRSSMWSKSLPVRH
eukprot:908830-Amphidinium_carterae.1